MRKGIKRIRSSTIRPELENIYGTGNAKSGIIVGFLLNFNLQIFNLDILEIEIKINWPSWCCLTQAEHKN